MVEILARRTATRKVFDLGNQQRLYRCHAGLIHYEDGGRTWQEIDTTLQSRLGGYYQDRCAYQCELPATADGIFAYHHRGQEFVTRVVGAQPSRGIPSVDRLGQLGKSLTYPHALGPGIHLVIEARNEGLRKLIRFDQPPPDPTRDFVVIFELQTDPGVVEVLEGEADLVGIVHGRLSRYLRGMLDGRPPTRLQQWARWAGGHWTRRDAVLGSRKGCRVCQIGAQAESSHVYWLLQGLSQRLREMDARLID